MQPDLTTAPRGVWLGASHRLGYPVPVDGPYPHVCGAGAQRRDCAPCVTGTDSPATLVIDAPSPSGAAIGPPFPAGYGGQCGACGGTVYEGDLIRMVSGQYRPIHADQGCVDRARGA